MNLTAATDAELAARADELESAIAIWDLYENPTAYENELGRVIAEQERRGLA